MSGKRNEVARSKRRQELKKAYSLTSVPKSEDDVPKAAKLNLNNHFGWTVLQKKQIGDGTFPHLFRFYEKPDVHGRDFDKVTYVLYMDRGTVIDKKTSLKETQTAVSGVLVAEREPCIEPTFIQEQRRQPYAESSFIREPVHERAVERTVQFPPERTRTFDQEPQERKKKKKIISDFYYVSKNRSRSPSENRHKGGQSDADNEWNKLMPGWSKSYHSEEEEKVPEFEGHFDRAKDENYALIIDEIEREREEAKRKGKHVKGWQQLRAGTERIEIEDKSKENRGNPSISTKRSSRLMEYAKFTSDKSYITEELLQTSSGTNQYLYVPKKRVARP